MTKFNFKKENSERGFTLIEMLVSVAIFSIVVLISLGAILTILDANRKSRTLTEVMNNLNFSIEMMTRSIKTGVEPEYSPTLKTLSVSAIILDQESNLFERERTRYRFAENGDRGSIEVCTDQNYEDPTCATDDWQPITAEAVDVDRFDVEYTTVEVPDGTQPRVQMFISGSVRINEKIVSDFAIQTTVSQRKLNLPGSELDLEN